MTDPKVSDEDGRITKRLPTPKFELNMKEGSYLFIQTSLGKYDKYEVIDGTYILVGTVE